MPICSDRRFVFGLHAFAGLCLTMALVSPISAQNAPTEAPAEKSASVPSTIAKPGIGATGDHFEAVFVPAREQGAVLALADANSNAALSGAKVEVEVARPAWKGQAKPSPTRGFYLLDWRLPAEKTEVTVIVTAGDRSDLILIPNVLRFADPSVAASHPPPFARIAEYRTIIIIAGATLVAVVLLAFGIVRFRRRGRAALTTAVVFALAFLDPGTPAAHPGHDPADGSHEEAGSGLIPGGRVTVPKAVQFVLEVRTKAVEKSEVANHVRLVGRIVPDPDAYARVQPSQISRMLADPAHPMPRPGQWVKRGDVVAVVQPILTAIERSEQRNALGKVETALVNTRRQLERYSSLKGVVPEKEIDQTKLEFERLTREKEQLLGHSLGRELLTAPIDGQVTEIHSVPGETVTAETTIVEITNPSKFRVEAILFDFSIVKNIRGGFATSRHFRGERFPLKLMGSSGRVTPKDQGIHIWFSVDNPKHLLRLDLPVDVLADIGTTEAVMTIPRESVFEMEGQSMVFIKIAPETFLAQPVTLRPFGGSQAEITEGLKAGDRVVVQGVQQLRHAR